VPTLRTKAGEVTALRWLQPQAKIRVVPVLQIMPSVSATFVADLAAAWGNLPIVLDGTAQSSASGSAGSFNAVFGALGAAGVPVMPMVEFSGQPPYLAAALGLQNQYSAGLAVRVGLMQVPHRNDGPSDAPARVVSITPARKIVD
jgi:hypothetical protein